MAGGILPSAKPEIVAWRGQFAPEVIGAIENFSRAFLCRRSPAEEYDAGDCPAVAHMNQCATSSWEHTLACSQERGPEEFMEAIWSPP